MSWPEWLFVASAIAAGVSLALLVGGTILIRILTGAIRKLNRDVGYWSPRP